MAAQRALSPSTLSVFRTGPGNFSRAAAATRFPLNHMAQAALCVALGSSVWSISVPAHAQTATEAARKNYQIPAGTLDQALSNFGRQAGVALAVSAELTAGLRSPGVSGNYAVPEALRALLAGTGLETVQEGGEYSFRKTASAAAQQHSALPAVSVTARAERSATTEGSGSYTGNVVTVGKGLLTLKEIPQSVTVVTRQRMDDQNLTSIDDVLANTTGITMYDSPMGGRYVFSRGFRVDTYQFDGVVRSFYYPQANNFTSDTDTLDRVEIVRGATGLLQGPGSPSAAINLVRKRPLAERQVQVAASVGSWNNRRVMVDATGPLNEDSSLRGRVVASYGDRDYFYDTAKRETGVLYGVLEYDFSPQTRLTAGLSIDNLRATPAFQGLPAYSNGTDLKLSRSTFLGADWNRWNGRQTAAFAELQHKFDADWSIKLTANATRETNDIKYAFALGTINPATLNGTNMYGALFDLKTENKSLDLSADGKFDLLGRRHGVSVGASVNEMTSDSTFYLSMLGVTNNVFNPTSPAEPSDAKIIGSAYRSDNSIVNMKQYGLYGVTRLSLADPLTLVLGSRMSWYVMSARDRVSGAPTQDPAKESAVLSPYGGLIYALSPQWSAYVSYSDIFQPTNAVTADGSHLAPVTGKNYEAGLKGELFDGRVNASVALFRIDQNNMSEEDLVNTCRTSTYCYVARGKVRSQGIDAELSGEVARGLQVFAGYTFNNLQYLDNTTDTQINFSSSYTPHHILRLWSDYRLPGELQAWSIGGGFNFQTASARKTGNITLEQPAYAVWSARVGYQVNRNWSLTLNVANLFDKTYYQTIGAPAWGNFYGDPRNATLALRGKF